MPRAFSPLIPEARSQLCLLYLQIEGQGEGESWRTLGSEGELLSD